MKAYYGGGASLPEWIEGISSSTASSEFEGSATCVYFDVFGALGRDEWSS